MATLGEPRWQGRLYVRDRPYNAAENVQPGAEILISMMCTARGYWVAIAKGGKFHHTDQTDFEEAKRLAPLIVALEQ